MPETPPLRRLLDLSEIHGLKARYCRCIDTKQWRALEELFTVDARFEGFGSAPTGANRETFVAGVSTRLADAVSVHHCRMPEIEFIGPDEARGIWAMEDYVDFPRGRDVAEAPGQRGYRGYGHYEEAYRRDGETWRFTFLRLTRLRIDAVSQADPPPRPGRLSASTGWLGHGA
ncbi:nuclear transport factor 2 family protein [Roseomonas chloroacetimidivorans]|uniref:nuclear transport factor 2 family protein n=1 Tax=Roseomonas chloroacetimidivorans TaxID=1766656 RepID=UPI003C72C20E